ncbi:hypothetical protein C2U68_02680 [Methylomonas koyamae]|nr:hypothetical protein C2U68_02680 [Methylomonas koyamae]
MYQQKSKKRFLIGLAQSKQACGSLREHGNSGDFSGAADTNQPVAPGRSVADVARIKKPT